MTYYTTYLIFNIPNKEVMSKDESTAEGTKYTGNQKNLDKHAVKETKNANKTYEVYHDINKIKIH
jgi:hypothetical protein